jgi:uncharacterized protein (TIRG00374 family)
MGMFSKSIKGIILGGTVSVVCLYLALRGANLSEVFSMISQIKFLYLLPMTGMILFAFVLRAIRWKYLLNPVKSVPVDSLFASTMIGFMANNVLPFRAGDIVRAYSISKNEQISLSSSVASLIVERLYDGIVVCLFMIPVLLFISLPAWLVNTNYILLAAYIMLVGGAVFLIWITRKNYNWWGKQRWEKVLRNFTAGLEGCTNGKQIIWSTLLSLAHWLVISGYYYLLFQACGLQLPFVAAIAMVVIISIGITLPAAPGFVGSFQYFTVIGLSLFSVPKEVALGFSLVAHAGQFIPVTLIGLFYLFRQSQGLTDLVGVEQQQVV